MSKMSPGPGSNGMAKKPRKAKDVSYRDDDEAESEEESNGQITMAQKQELASSMENVNPEVLQQVIQIIQQSTDLGSVSGTQSFQLIFSLTRLNWISIPYRLAR
jgi:bromodomain-containing factor 1